MPSGAASRQTKRIDFGSRLLQPLDRRHRRVAGGQHRVEHDRVALVHAVRHLEVVLDRHQRLRVAVQADVADARAGNHARACRRESRCRRAGSRTNTIFLPSITGLVIVSSGVSISISVRRHVARDLVGHQHADLAEQAAEARWCCVSFWRISVSLCCTSGCAMTWTSGGLELKVCSCRTRSARAAALRKRVPSLATTTGGSPPSRRSAAMRAAGGPGAAFEQARERQRCGVDAEHAAHQRRQLVEQRHGQRAPFDDPAVAPADRMPREAPQSRGTSTPASSSSPPLRYSGRPVSASSSCTCTPAHSNGSSSE